MKKVVLIFLFFAGISCAKKEGKKEVVIEDHTTVTPYDTTAIDSFSTGAISVDVARKIKMSSVAFQDSLMQVRKKMEAEKLLKKEKDDKDKATKKAEEDLKKAEASKLKKEKDKSLPENPLKINPSKP